MKRYLLPLLLLLLLIAGPAMAQQLKASMKQQLDTMVADVTATMASLSATVVSLNDALVKSENDLATERSHSADPQKRLDTATKPPSIVHQREGD